MLNFFLKRINKKEKGFTLVELIIVVAVIGILAAVAAPKGVGLINKSKVSRVVGDVKAIKTAALLYVENSTTSSYPTDISDLSTYLDSVPDEADDLDNGAVAYYSIDASHDLTITFSNDDIGGDVADALSETYDDTAGEKNIVISLD